MTVDVNGTTMNMELDTGYAFSLISKQQYKDLLSATPLQISCVLLKTYTSERIISVCRCKHTQRPFFIATSVFPFGIASGLAMVQKDTTQLKVNRLNWWQMLQHMELEPLCLIFFRMVKKNQILLCPVH